MLAGAVGGAPARVVADDGPGCAFRAVTGVPCPFCGMTHAVVAMGDGDLAGALAQHPASPLIAIGVLAISIAIASGRTAAVASGRRAAVWTALLGAAWIAKLAAA